MVHDKKKKPKLAGNGAGPPTGSTLSQSDKVTIERWNKLHHIGRMSVQTLQGKAEETDARLQQQEELIKNQLEDLDKQQRQLYEQQWLIQEQAEQIRVLLHQQKILIRECKTAGISIPISTPDPSPLTTPLAKMSSSSSSASPVSSANVPRSSDRVDKPAPAITSSSSSKQLPPVVCPLPPPSRVEPPAQPPPHHPKLAPPLHSSVTAIRPRPLNTYPTLQPRIISAPQPQPMNFQPPQPVSLPHSYGYSTQQQPVPNRSPSYIPPPYPAPNTGLAAQGMAGFNTSEFFSPLTSRDLMELTSKEVQKLSPFESNSVGGFDPPFPEDLDNFFPLPMGCGAGYGVGVPEDELSVTIPPPGAVA